MLRTPPPRSESRQQPWPNTRLDMFRYWLYRGWLHTLFTGEPRVTISPSDVCQLYVTCDVIKMTLAPCGALSIPTCLQESSIVWWRYERCESAVTRLRSRRFHYIVLSFVQPLSGRPSWTLNPRMNEAPTRKPAAQ